MKQIKKGGLNTAIKQWIFASKRKTVATLTLEAEKKYNDALKMLKNEKRKASNDLRPRKHKNKSKSELENVNRHLLGYQQNPVEHDDYGFFEIKELWQELQSRLKQLGLKQISFSSFKIKMANVPKSSLGGNRPDLFIEAAAWLVFPECWPDYSKVPPKPKARFSPILKPLMSSFTDDK